MIFFFSGFAFVHQNPAEQGGRFQLCIFILKKYKVFETVTFLLPSRSNTVVPHRDKLLLLCWLLPTCEQQKLSPRTPSNYDSGKCLLPGPTNIRSAEAAPGVGCIESLRVGNFWALKGMGAVSSSPYSMHTAFLDLPVKTQRDVAMSSEVPSFVHRAFLTPSALFQYSDLPRPISTFTLSS